MINRHALRYDKKRTALYRAEGYWGDATLLDAWKLAVLRHPDKTAVIDAQGASFTFRQADRLANRLSRYLLEAGIRAGDIVSAQIPGWAEFLIIYAACLKSGSVLSPIHTNLRCKETYFMLQQCQSKALFIPYRFKKYKYPPMLDRIRPELPRLNAVIVVDKFAESGRKDTFAEIVQTGRPHDPARDRAPGEPEVLADDVAAVLYTSGSEGDPKGVVLSHNNILASESFYAAHYNFTQHDVMLMPAPVTHATGYLHGVTAPFLVGATTVLQDRLDPEKSLRLVEKHRCTICAAAETFLHDMLCRLRQDSFDVSSLRLFLSGGSPTSPRLIEESARYGIVACNVYGSTESAPHAGTLPGQAPERRTAGLPMTGVEVRIVDKNRQPLPPGVEGEEASRGPQVFLGYLNAPGLTAQALDDDGWYYSGDLGVLDAAGCLRITGRIKDIIIRGGENISSLEIEQALLRHPNIREAAVVAMPDPRLSERVCAYVVLEDPRQGLSFDELFAFMETLDIAKYKYPERLEIVDILPKTASGKVKKADLRREIAAKPGVKPYRE